jgi:broad-specificity NMP kinase
VNSQLRLRNLVNEEMNKIASAVRNLSLKVKDEVVKIKLDEVAKSIKPLTNKDKIKDSHLINLMQYYDLVNELKTL